MSGARVTRTSSSSKKKQQQQAAEGDMSPTATATPLRRRASSSKKKAASVSPAPVRSSSRKKSARVASLVTGGESAESSPLASPVSPSAESPVADAAPSSSVQSSSSSSLATARDNSDKHVWEFGGPIGVSLIMTIFPCLMFYFWSCLAYNKGALYFPDSLTSGDAWRAFGLRLLGYVQSGAMPTLYSVQIYWGYTLWSALLAYFMPGPTVLGMPVPSLKGKQLPYLCNGYSSFYFTVAVSLVLNHYRVFPLRDIVDNFGPLLTTAIVSGWSMSVVTYLVSMALGTGHRLSGNHVYDMFMGAPLNPRIGRLDLKLWCEIRVPWVILFYVSLSAVVKQWEQHGADFNALFQVPAGLYFTLLGHWIYVNACMKGEDCIPATWDIFYEKWGFMLIFWNMAGVPFTYCYNTLYLLARAEAGNPVQHPWSVNAALVAVLLSAYYVWDVAQAQKSHFRQTQANTLLKRYTFPQFSAGHLKEPSFIRTKHGSPLLTAGFWGVARKIHYTADFTMAMCWALITGFQSPIPYFYPCFFFVVLVHRVTRDMQRCAMKYGDDWKEYCRRVPWIFIPGIF